MKRLKDTHRKVAGRRPKAGPTMGDTRTEILSAARRVFAKKGLAGTSVREVASAANVNNAMIYYHFKDKDHLYRSVLNDSFSAMTDIWSDPVFTAKVPVRRKLKVYIERYIKFQMVNDDLRRIMAMEFAGSGGNITWICEEYFADNFVRLTAIFKEGMRTGELKKFDPSLAVASLVGVIVHNFILQPMAAHMRGKAANLSPKKLGAFVTELLFNGLSSKKRINQRSIHIKKRTILP
jgi:TetR/AcrR family transcriptional regulator